MKINIFKKITTFIAFLFIFLFVADSVESYWQCNSPRKNNSAYDYRFQWDRQTRAEIIRFRAAAPSNWGNNCAVGCPNPSGCGSCECRCQGNDLYCADIWTWTSRGVPRVATQTCSWNVRSSYDGRCIPYSNIASPANNSYYDLGSDILFSANGSRDGNGERLSYHWIIRPSSGADIRIDTYSRNFNRSNLPVGDYTAYLAVRNKQGVYASPTWRWVRFSVGASVDGVCGTSGGTNAEPVALDSAPTTNLCGNTTPASTASAVNGGVDGPWNWTCTADSATTCYARKAVTGTCGTSGGINTAPVVLGSTPTTNLCGNTTPASTVSAVNGGVDGPWNWTCTADSATTCYARKAVAGTCGSSGSSDSSNPIELSDTPVSSLCATGAASGVSGNGYPGLWSWTCTVDNPVTCYAEREPQDGSCGSSSSNNYENCGTFFSGESKLCSTGTVVDKSPNSSQSCRWRCEGFYGGSTTDFCSTVDVSFRSNWIEVPAN